ncbi:hypothetical protein PR003_g26488 [Phytophthora rubi]|uniref:Uncharacterized protein n=1 Tax=Phytophthora rubi TaxID=129364 RepID=A0A6A3IAE5_9STRA|nr:hypothetical protein PR002_g25620 [Phytophthora rubi]KAE8977735.1 hypothetical protein PR001_g25047 [Phytophthora rubi]KAE9285779.1 hypothetical protein PR003_g26488 [Phytophthora rubi]
MALYHTPPPGTAEPGTTDPPSSISDIEAGMEQTTLTDSFDEETKDE